MTKQKAMYHSVRPVSLIIIILEGRKQVHTYIHTYIRETLREYKGFFTYLAICMYVRNISYLCY